MGERALREESADRVRGNPDASAERACRVAPKRYGAAMVMAGASVTLIRSVLAGGVLTCGVACAPRPLPEAGEPGGKSGSAEAAPAQPGPAGETVRGTLRYFDLEGGFWGIVTDSGERLRVVGTAAPGWRDASRVVARVRRLPGGPSLQQWGEPVAIVELGSAPERRPE